MFSFFSFSNCVKSKSWKILFFLSEESISYRNNSSLQIFLNIFFKRNLGFPKSFHLRRFKINTNYFSPYHGQNKKYPKNVRLHNLTKEQCKNCIQRWFERENENRNYLEVASHTSDQISLIKLIFLNP